ncbi:DUF4124 domain-containing protein [Acidovorax soli]|uniref:DUF4124 domain-containing protein n=1 Tax=Acidovorax TaxID=12916 RepID=UPI0026F1E7A3|nr:hypothetical protein [Acidovorax soli]MCM2347916.1 DUF4124 domain-containing protein [Acidovorax soli]
MFKPAILLTAVMLSATPAWAINKCTGPDGKVVFQDAPCADGKGEKLNIRSTSAPAASVGATGDAQARLEKMKRDNEMAEAIRTRKPLVGMTLAQLQEAMGLATKVNANNYNGTQSEQVIYERPQETWLVYTRNGVVDSIQYRPGSPIGAAPARATGRCPTQHEINNAITSASSMTVSDAERAERWKTIRVMQACGK